MHCILVIHLIQEELLQLEQLVPLDIFRLLCAANMTQLLNGGRELEVDESVDAVQDTALSDGDVRFVSGLWVDFRLRCHA